MYLYRTWEQLDPGKQLSFAGAAGSMEAEIKDSERPGEYHGSMEAG